ncbi:MAG: tryptophan--tRNA ligase [Clostridiales bacterium]|jgi:tryptophanyl-tRNA synthetase|nr:tryptophan--tRNA ligase [Clostridiales bacterium]
MLNESNAAEKPQKIVFSAIQPTGALTLGNYIGAVKNFLALQEEYKCYYAVADLHSVTANPEPALLRKNTLDLFALFLAFGLDPARSTLFVQSHVPFHTALTWVLNCNTAFGEAKRMTQFKDKSQKSPQNVNVGLFDYPVLMAADILLYKADYVPIGKDQNQHLELTRAVAERFNARYGATFTVPEGVNPRCGAKIFSLANPAVKMSKSDDNPSGPVLLLDPPDVIAAKFRRAVTDSETVVRYDPKNKPGVSNLLAIYASLLDIKTSKAEKDFEGADYAALKSRVADVVISVLEPIQKRYRELAADKASVASLMKDGADKASAAAYRTMSKVYKRIGLV